VFVNKTAGCHAELPTISLLQHSSDDRKQQAEEGGEKAWRNSIHCKRIRMRAVHNDTADICWHYLTATVALVALICRLFYAQRIPDLVQRNGFQMRNVS
jgi:predicted membrane channel-forming protein YqfA (hemolysin III family)